MAGKHREHVGCEVCESERIPHPGRATLAELEAEFGPMRPGKERTVDERELERWTWLDERELERWVDWTIASVVWYQKRALELDEGEAR